MATSPQLVFTRGARRSTAPSIVPMQPIQTGALGSQPGLAQLLHQITTQVQQQQPAAMQQPAGYTPVESELMAALRSTGLPHLPMPRQLTDEEAQRNLGNDRAQSEYDANAGPMSPGMANTLRTALAFGLSGIGLPSPVTAALMAATKDPNSETAPTAAAVTSAVADKVPGFGLINMLAQAFGLPSAQKQVQNAITPTARETQPPAPVVDAVMSPVTPQDQQRTFIEQLVDEFGNYYSNVNIRGGGTQADWQGGFGTNQSAGGTTSHGEGDGGATRTA